MKKKRKEDVHVDDFFVSEICKIGGTAQLARHLMRLGEKACLAWIIRRFTKKCEGMNIEEKLILFSEQYDISFNSVRNAYYFPTYTPMKELEEQGFKSKYPEFREVRKAVTRMYPYPAVWDEMFPFCWRYIKVIAIEILIEEDKYIYSDIELMLNVSKSTIIRVKKRMMQEKENQMLNGKE